MKQEKARQILNNLSPEMKKLSDLSQKSLAEYTRKINRMNLMTPKEYAQVNNLKKSTYKTYRAAALHMYAFKLRDSLQYIDKLRKAKNKEEAQKERARMANFAEMLDKIQNESYYEPSYIEDTSAQKKQTKRKSLRGLPKDWPERVLSEVPEQYKKLAAIAHLSGCRPSEFEKPVRVILTKGKLEVIIFGSKYDAEFRGQKKRRLIFSISTPQAEAVQFELFGSHSSGQVFVQFQGKETPSSFSKSYKRAAVRALGKTKGKQVSPYSARHLFSANLKKERFSQDQIAKALGQQSAASQRHYGHPGQGRISGLLRVDATQRIRPAKAKTHPSPDRGHDHDNGPRQSH